MLRYAELKTGHNDNGPAWIGSIQMSRSGRTIFFNGKALKRTGRPVSGNHYDLSITGAKVLEPFRFVVSHSIKTTGPEKFHDAENE